MELNISKADLFGYKSKLTNHNKIKSNGDSIQLQILQRIVFRNAISMGRHGGRLYDDDDDDGDDDDQINEFAISNKCTTQSSRPLFLFYDDAERERGREREYISTN